MKIFRPLIDFILKFVHLIIGFLLKPRGHHHQHQSQTLADAEEGRRGTEVEHNDRLNFEATAGENSTVTRPMQAHANPLGGSEEYDQVPESRPTTRRQRKASDDHIQLQWRLLMIAICFATVGIALQALQTVKDVPVHKGVQFHCFLMALVFSLAYLTVSVYVRQYSEAAALILEQAAVVFGAMAFLLVITIAEFPHAAIIASLAIFLVSLLIVLLATFLLR